jgi:cytochrome c-type biogenesis protein CcmH
MIGQTTIVRAEVSENRVREIAHKLRCPTCQALSVKESEAGIAENMKIKIRSLLEEGKSEEQILKYFTVRYGEWILRAPEKKGFNLLLWFLPGTLIVLAIVVIVLRLNSTRSDGSSPSTEQEHLTKQEQQEIDKEMEKLERS